MNTFLMTLTALILTIGATHIQAQNIGLKSGVNVANFYDSDFDSDNRIAFNIGLYGNVDVKHTPFSIQPELYYSQKGSVSTWQTGDILTDGTFRLDYIETPLLIKFTNSFTSFINLNLMAGPSFAYLLRSTYSSNDIKDSTRSTDFGLVGSIGLDFPIASQQISIETRYTRGISNVFESGFNPECCGEFERPQKNSAVSVIFGIGL